MHTKQNQAQTMYPLFFDPIYKRVSFETVDGKNTITYHDEPWAVKVEENGEVSFSLFAPDADTVEVAGISGSMSRDHIRLTKGEDGMFRGSARIGRGFHYHNWFVDGAQVVHPGAPIAYGCFGATNFFEVPGEGEDFWFLKEVPHGDVSIHMYTSAVNMHMKKCLVYTPPKYSENPDKKYPVLYIQHGVGEDETGWIWNGKINFILDNLIAEGACEEMIVVMCSGYAFKKGEDPVFYPGDFAAELTGDCIPYIETHFRVKKGRSNRAMAGLSLGSAQATQIVARYQHLFAHLGVFSGVRYEENEQILSQQAQYPMQTIYMTAGVGEKGLDEIQKKYTDQFAALGIAGGQKSYEGFHEWHVWRESVRDFAKLIFRKDLCESEEAFVYHETVLTTEQLDEQTFREHMLMFDPIYKGLIYAFDEKGNPAGRYKDEHAGWEIVDVKAGKAAFWYRSAGASRVEIDIWGMEKQPMFKGEDDWWHCEISGIEKGFHYYGVKVNGVDVVDGNAPVGYGGFRSINYLEMPEEDFEEYRIRQVPHGAVHMNYYQSGETGRQKLCYVYTPASYETEPEKRYPVLYLQHGGGENEMGWIWQGRIANIADNLIAAGEMKEMIIVMNTGYGFPENRPCHPSMSAFLQELPDSCIAYIDSTYRTIADRRFRSMAGLSMGGMQTQKIVFARPELFASAGIFSGGLTIQNEEDDYRPILFDPEEFARRFELLFVAVGTCEGFYDITRKNEEEVISKGIPLVTFEGYGYHDWTFWRHCANDFLRRLFTWE